MKYLQILSELWTKPALITPQMHRSICEIVEMHMMGEVRDLTESEKRSQQQMTYIDNIAVIPVYGVIARGTSKIQDSSGCSCTYKTGEMLQLALEDSRVEGILFDFDSPGGSVTGTPEMAAKIRAASMQKHTMAYVESLCASAAYWWASQTDTIFTAQTAHTGSIGVYMAWLDDSRKLEMQGERVELIKRGKFKAMGLQGTSLTDEQRNMLQDSVDKVYEWFTEAVLENRPDVKKEALEGQTFYADDAFEMGLIDDIGSREEAIEQLQNNIRDSKRRRTK